MSLSAKVALIITSTIAATESLAPILDQIEVDETQCMIDLDIYCTPACEDATQMPNIRGTLVHHGSEETDRAICY